MLTPSTRRSSRGFTLAEAVVVIAVTGILAAMVAVFIRTPVEGYFDAVRRAEMSDTADGALRRIGRDLRLALPNSVRVSSDGRAMEFLQTRTGGRYRIEATAAGAGDILDFTAVDTSFDVLGAAVPMVVGEQNIVAVYNLGIDGANAYNGDNTSPMTGSVGNNIRIAAKQFPLASPGGRFHVISYPVSYVCDPSSRTLRRYWNYTILSAQPTTFGAGVDSALVASDVDCSFVYAAQAIRERAGFVSLQARIERNGEAINLLHEVHVSNVP